MSRELLESIINRDYVIAGELFESSIAEIMERKLYEEKRRLAAINELVKPDPKRPGQFVGQNTKADWAKYRKQNKQPKTPNVEVPSAPMGSGKRLNASDIKKRRKAGYLRASEAIPAKKFIDAVTAHLKKKKGIEESKQGPFLSGSEAELRRAQNAPEVPTGDKADASAMAKSSKTKRKVGRGKFSALRDIVGQKRSQDTADWAERKYQQHIDRRALRSVGNIAKGQNVKANLKILGKTALKTTAAKKLGGFYGDIGDKLEE